VAGLPVGLALITLGFAPVMGQDAQQSAYRNSIAQESVRKQADKIQTELGQLVAELKLNGLGGANLATLSQASTHLSGLSQEEMQKVINALQNASVTSDDGKRQQSLVTAYQGQQDLVLKLKKLASALASQQAGDKLVNQLEDLIARQSANIRQTSTLVAGGHKTDQLDAKEKTVHSLATTEQTAIGGQIDILFTNLTAQAGQTPATPDPSAASIKAVLDAMTGTLLKETAATATQLTTAGPFDGAVAKQTAVRQYLTKMLSAASSKADAATRLTQAKNQLQQVAADQKDLADITKQKKVDAATLAERQAQINDRAEVAKALLQPLNPDAAKKVDAAQQDMKQSADALNDPAKQQDAAAKQDDATKALADADKMLDQQMADIQKQQNQTPTEQMAQLQKIADEIKQAQQAQDVSPKDAAKQAQQAQKDAMVPSPDAASKLADAADKLQQQAAQQPADPQQGQQPQQPSQNSDAIKQDLAQAAQAIQAQQDALAKSAQDYQALAQTQQALDQAQKDAAAADQSLQNGTGNDLSDPARKLKSAQDQVSQAAQNPTPGMPGDAQQAMQQAADALKNASIQAVQANRSGADAQAKAAMGALQQAQNAVGQAMAQVQAQAQQQQGQGQGQQMAQQQQNSQALGGTSNAGSANQQLGGSGTGPVQRGTALVMGGLNKKDRDAITQYQAEKTPAEYAPLVQQYLKNLADVSETH